MVLFSTCKNRGVSHPYFIIHKNSIGKQGKPVQVLQIGKQCALVPICPLSYSQAVHRCTLSANYACWETSQTLRILQNEILKKLRLRLSTIKFFTIFQNVTNTFRTNQPEFQNHLIPTFINRRGAEGIL